MLRILCVGIFAAAIAVLAYDFNQLMRQQQAGQGLTLRFRPASFESVVPVARPQPDTRLRPTLPDARPVMPGRATPARQGGHVLSGVHENERMKFMLEPNGKALAVGTIEPGTAHDFERFLRQAGRSVRTLVLHSPGGHVPDAIEMAHEVRRRMMVTMVDDDAYCASSCPLVFAGGVERIAGQKAWIGVHQIYALDATLGSLQEGMREAQLVSASAQELLDQLGVDARVWIYAMRTPKEKLYFFTDTELTRYRLATRIGPAI